MVRRCSRLPAVLALGMAIAMTGCASRLATASLAETLSRAGHLMASDDDPALVRDAAPFALKAMEVALAERPRDAHLLLATCRGFAQYAHAFVEIEAERVEIDDYALALTLRRRARRLFLRARGYCLRRLELGHRGLRPRLMADPVAAVAGVDDTEVLYWTAVSWGGAIANGVDRPELVADAPVVRALLERALALDEGYGEGAIYEALIPIEAALIVSSESLERARSHFRNAVRLSGGRAAGPYVTFATSVSIKTQNRAELTRLLEQALAVDPDAAPERRLMNLVAQARARSLLARVDDLFASREGAAEPTP